jgi:hypothetical protein
VELTPSEESNDFLNSQQLFTSRKCAVKRGNLI